MDMVAFAEVRKARGLEIARSKKIAKVNDRLWAVPSQTHAGKWVVDTEAGTCMCPDFETNGKPCKHLYAIEYARHQVTDANGTTVVTETLKITYGQKWPEYRAARRSEKWMVQALLKSLCAGIEQPAYKGNGRPALPLADVVYGITMKVYTGKSGDLANTEIQECQQKGLIDAAPHVNSVFRYLAKPELTPILTTMIAESAAPLSAVETGIAADATGFGTTTYNRWFDHKWGKERKGRQKWLKAHVASGVKTNIITAIDVTQGNEGDAPYLPALLSETSARFDVKEVYADKGYVSVNNVEAISALGATPYIKLKPNNRDKPEVAAWNRMFHMFHAHRDEFLTHYNKRQNVEATFSMIKRKFGPNLRSKGFQAQVNEVLAKALCHNLCVLNHEIHELGIDVSFWGNE